MGICLEMGVGEERGINVRFFERGYMGNGFGFGMNGGDRSGVKEDLCECVGGVYVL